MKAIAIGLILIFSFAVIGCGPSAAYREEVRKNAVKTRSENSARQGMTELDRETR